MYNEDLALNNVNVWYAIKPNRTKPIYSRRKIIINKNEGIRGEKDGGEKERVN